MPRLPVLPLALAFFAALATPLPATAQERLTVLLDWFVNPDHAPLIIAQQRGYFAEAGLEVELIAPADPNDPPKLVAAKRADIAVSYQPQLHLQVAQGLPVARIGTLIATPLNTLVVKADGPIDELGDLAGARVGFSVGGFEDALLSAMLGEVGLSLDDITLINVNFSLSPSLIAGQTDAVIGAFRNFELNQMDLVGTPGRAFYPEEHGVPAYDELIYIAHRDELDRPALDAFLTAVERGALWTINHPEAAWDLFRRYDPELDDALNRLAWDDTLPRLAQSPAALDVGRYTRFAAFLQQQGLIEGEMPAVADYAVDLGAR